MVSLLGLYYGSLGLVGLGSSLISLSTVYRQRSPSESPLGLCLANLASNQLGLVCFGGWTFLMPSHFAHHWIWGDDACFLFGTLKQYFQLVVFHGIFLLSLEHYMRLRVSSKKHYNHSFFFALTLWTWVSVGIWTVLPFLGWGKYIKKEYTCEVSMSMMSVEGNWIEASYPLCLTFFTFIVPTGFISHFLGSIVMIIRRRTNLKQTNLQVNTEDGRQTIKVTIFLAIFSFSIYFLLILLGFLDWILVYAPEEWATPIFPLETVHSVLSQTTVLISPLWYFIFVSPTELQAWAEPEPERKTKLEKVDESDSDRLPPLLRNYIPVPSGLDEVSDGDEDTIHVLESNLDWDASTSTVQGSVQHF